MEVLETVELTLMGATSEEEAVVDTGMMSEEETTEETIAAVEEVVGVAVEVAVEVAMTVVAAPSMLTEDEEELVVMVLASEWCAVAMMAKEGPNLPVVAKVPERMMASAVALPTAGWRAESACSATRQ